MNFHDIYEEKLHEQRLEIERLISANSIYHEINNSKALAVEKLQSQLEAANKIIEVLENGHKEIQVIHYLGKNNQPKMYIQSCQTLAEVEKIRNGGEV